MPTWVRSLVNAFLGKVPGKTSRRDTATRMMIDADFSLDRKRPRESRPEPLRVCRRPFCLSHAAMALSFSMAK